MFGVRADFDGTLTVDPHPPAYAPDIALKNLRLQGHTLDITIQGTQYTVHTEGKDLTAEIGKATKLPPAEKE
jgi:hypothetical protein